MSESPLPDFSYDGRLVFNAIHKTNILDSKFDFEDVIQGELTDFKEGTLNKPGKGYRVLPFQEYLSEQNLDRRLEKVLGEIHAFRYLEERWEFQEVELDGATEDKPTKTGLTTFDAYWAHPDYLFVKGNKTQADLASDLLDHTLEDYLAIDELEFASEFLLWIFSTEKNGEDLPGNLATSMLTDAELSGSEPDLFGQHSKVDDSTDITKSVPILMGVLQQKGLVALEGVFNLAGKFVRARISTDGRVHIKADHAIEGSSDLERIAISVAFLKEFTDLYERWLNLEAERRYPPTEFFLSIYEECQRQGVKIEFSIDEVIQKFREKGGTEEYQQYQSGLDDFQQSASK